MKARQIFAVMVKELSMVSFGMTWSFADEWMEVKPSGDHAGDA